MAVIGQPPKPAKPPTVLGPQNIGLPGYRPGDPPAGGPPPHVVVGPQNVGLPGYRPGDPNPGGGPGTVAPVKGPAYTGAPPDPVAAPAAAPPAAPNWADLIAHDPEGNLQHTYLDQQNQLTTAALRNAWLMHTQSAQDAFNSHGGLFSGANVNAHDNIGRQHDADQGQQDLNYAKGSHTIDNQTGNRLIRLATGVDNGLGGA